MLATDIIEIAYIVAVVLFILSLKWLSSPATARRGVLAGELGMLLAIVRHAVSTGIVDTGGSLIALVLGAIIGVPLGTGADDGGPTTDRAQPRVRRLCVTLVGTAEFYLRAPHIPRFMMAVLALEVILGGLTFTGSLMAAGKLQEILPQRPIVYAGRTSSTWLCPGGEPWAGGVAGGASRQRDLFPSW